MLNDIPFEQMATVGRFLIQSARENRYPTDESLARAARMDVNLVQDFLWNPSFDLFTGLTGKQWARLISAAGVFPETWIKKADEIAKKRSSTEVSFEHHPAVRTAPEFLNSGSGVRPSDEAQARIKVLLSVTDSFYYTASENYAQRHGDGQPT